MKTNTKTNRKDNKFAQSEDAYELSLKEKHAGLVECHKKLVKTNEQLRIGLKGSLGCLGAALVIAVIALIVVI